MNISIIQPSRNNLKYLKWSYESIRKNQGEHQVEICVADDFSNDGTWNWCLQKMEEDSNFKAIRNNGPVRLGHTILYDRLINEVATKDIAMIYHADMYLCPGAIDAIERYIKEKTIVSLTRIEPPLHPDGPEKVLRDFGTEPEDFPEENFLEWYKGFNQSKRNVISTGIFAPWAFYRSDFQEIGGHDPLFAPQSKEDSDIFNRFLLNGVKFIQTWEGCVYHMTCRGSRFNPTLTTVGQESDEWLRQNERSSRNFIRKWGHFVRHDKMMKPIVPPRYNIGLVLFNATVESLYALEPWFQNVYVDNSITEQYINKEQPNTKFNLSDKIKYYTTPYTNDIIIRLDSKKLDNTTFQYIQQLPDIIKNTGSTGNFSLDPLEISINHIQEYQNELIHL